MLFCFLLTLLYSLHFIAFILIACDLKFGVCMHFSVAWLVPDIGMNNMCSTFYRTPVQLHMAIVCFGHMFRFVYRFHDGIVLM